MCSHVWAIFFYNAQFSLWWSCGDLAIKNASICLKCLMVLQLQVAQCQTSFVLYFVLPFCFTYLHYDSITFDGFFGFLTCYYMWTRNIIFMELLAFCFHDPHKFSDYSFPSFKFLDMFSFLLKTLKVNSSKKLVGMDVFKWTTTSVQSPLISIFKQQQGW